MGVEEAKTPKEGRGEQMFDSFQQILCIFVYLNTILYKAVVLAHKCSAAVWFLPERDYVTFESLLSQFRLSVVCRL